MQSNLKNYQQFEFVADMGMLYAACDGVVARSGSGTVFEVLALKKPALFIPLQGQTRGDQAENAAYFEKKGLCQVLKQENLALLEENIHRLFANEALKRNLSQNHFPCGNATILKALYGGR